MVVPCLRVLSVWWLCPVVAPMLAWVVAAVVITVGSVAVVVRYRADGGAPAGSVRMAGVLSSLSATVVDIVGAAAPWWGRVGSTGARPKSPPTAAERLTSGWFTDIRVATRAPRLRSARCCWRFQPGERFTAAAVTYPFVAGLPSSWSSSCWVVGLSPDGL